MIKKSKAVIPHVDTILNNIRKNEPALSQLIYNTVKTKIPEMDVEKWSRDEVLAYGIKKGVKLLLNIIGNFKDQEYYSLDD